MSNFDKSLQSARGTLCSARGLCEARVKDGLKLEPLCDALWACELAADAQLASLRGEGDPVGRAELVRKAHRLAGELPRSCRRGYVESVLEHAIDPVESALLDAENKVPVEEAPESRPGDAGGAEGEATEPESMTLQEVADRLKVSTTTVYRMLRQGMLEGYKVKGRRVKITVESLIRLIRDSTVQEAGHGDDA